MIIRHIVGLSGGKDSTAMSIRLKKAYPNTTFEFICTPTGNELPEMVEHWATLETILNQPIIKLSNTSLYSLILEQKALPNWRMRWCTRMLKILPFQSYVLNAALDKETAAVFTYVGIRADEIESREGVTNWGAEKVHTIFPLVEWGWTIEHIRFYLETHNISITERTDCALCFFQTLSEWHTLYTKYPEEYARGEVLEDYTKHTFRSPQRDTHAASLKGLRAEFEAGYVPKPKNMSNRLVMCSTCAR